MSLSYAQEKLDLAVDGMAASPASIQRRIADAYIFHLIHIDPEEDLPADLRGLYAEIHTALTKLEAIENEGQVMATVEFLTNDEAVEIAGKIVRLSDQVSAALLDSGDEVGRG